jgi:putative nucleotidyltransferase-like protein
MSTREFQLLLYCARLQPDAGRIKDAVREGINWETLLDLARQHRVRPLLIRSLKEVCWDAVPSMSRLELESFYRESIVRNLLFTGELLRLLDAFRKQGVAIAALKGPILAEVVYGDLSLREFVDLDILVHEADVCKAEQILTVCGYKCDVPGKDYRSAFFSYYGQQPFQAQTGVIVDLHWRLASKNVALPIQSAAVWSRLRNATIVGRTVPTLAQEDLALFLAAHGTMHGWGSLIWLCDFAEFLGKHQYIDWATVFEQAQRARSSQPLLLAVFLASSLLDAPAPAELVIKAGDNAAVRALAEKARLGMLHPTSQGDFGEFLTGLSTYDLWRHRLWPVVSLFMTRTINDHWAMPLPKPFWCLYYLTRPFRLAGRIVHMLRAFSK